MEQDQQQQNEKVWQRYSLRSNGDKKDERKKYTNFDVLLSNARSIEAKAESLYSYIDAYDLTAVLYVKRG